MNQSAWFQITWDGSAYGEIEADTALKTRLCGICGNFNDNPADDLTMKDGRSDSVSVFRAAYDDCVVGMLYRLYVLCGYNVVVA